MYLIQQPGKININKNSSFLQRPFCLTTNIVHRLNFNNKKHVQQFGDERLSMVEGGWDPEILITGHAGK